MKIYGHVSLPKIMDFNEIVLTTLSPGVLMINVGGIGVFQDSHQTMKRISEENVRVRLCNDQI